MLTFTIADFTACSIPFYSLTVYDFTEYRWKLSYIIKFDLETKHQTFHEIRI